MTYRRRKELLHLRAFTTISTDRAESYGVAEGVSIPYKDIFMRLTSYDMSPGRDTSLVVPELSFQSELPSLTAADSEKAREIWRTREILSNFSKTMELPHDFQKQYFFNTETRETHCTSRPSASIDRMLATRRKRHEDACGDMKNELAAVYRECNNEIRIRSAHVKIELNRIRDDIESIQKKLQQTDLGDLRDEDLDAVWKEVRELINLEKDLIDKFMERLSRTERKRLERTKPILQKYCKILHRVSYFLPYEIQMDLENEIVKYNQAVLGNHRSYADLHLQMRLLVDTSKIKLKNWMVELRRRLRESLCVDMLKDFE